MTVPDTGIPNRQCLCRNPHAGMWCVTNQGDAGEVTPTRDSEVLFGRFSARNVCRCLVNLTRGKLSGLFIIVLVFTL